MTLFDDINTLAQSIEANRKNLDLRGISLGKVCYVTDIGLIKVVDLNSSQNYVSNWLKPSKDVKAVHLDDLVLYSYPTYDLSQGVYFQIFQSEYDSPVLPGDGVTLEQVNAAIELAIAEYDVLIKGWVNSQNFTTQNWVNSQNFTTLPIVQNWVNTQNFTTLPIVQNWVNTQNFTTLPIVQNWVNTQNFATQNWVNTQNFTTLPITQNWVNSQNFTTLPIVQNWVNSQNFTTLPLVQTWVNSQNFTTLPIVQNWVNTQNFASQTWVDDNFTRFNEVTNPLSVWRYGVNYFFQGSKGNSAQLSDQYADRHITIMCLGSRLPTTGGTQDPAPNIGLTLDGSASGLEQRFDVGTEIFLRINTTARIHLRWFNNITVNGVNNSTTTLNVGTLMPLRTAWKLNKTALRTWTLIDLGNFNYIPFN